MLRCRLTVTPEQVNIRVSPTCPVFKRAKRATPEIGFHPVLSVPENKLRSWFVRLSKPRDTAGGGDLVPLLSFVSN